MIIENKVFYPQGGCGGPKNFFFRHLRHLGENLRKFRILAGGFDIFIYFLVLEEWVPKQLKQVSIVGKLQVKLVTN